MTNCKECIREIVCKYNDDVNEYCKGNCPHFKDHSKFVELPCKIGTKVFVTPDRGKHFHKATLYGCDEKGTFLVFVNDNELLEDEKHIVANPMLRCFYDWFLKVYTKEEAEKALEERENNGDVNI